MHTQGMDIYGFNMTSFASFLLTLIRVSLLVFMMPFYNGDYVPTLVKAALAIVLTMALWPHLSFPGAVFPQHHLAVATMLISELILGLILYLCVSFIFAGIATGGEIMGFQMGFSMMTIADPTSGQQTSVTSQLLNTVSLMVFLALDGHLVMLRALADSFVLIPPGGVRVSGELAWDVLQLSGIMFSLAIKIAAPVIAALFMTELTLALMGRAAPQMNLLTLGFPAKISVGFFFVSLLFTTLSLYMEDLVIGLGPMFQNIMRMAR